MESIESIHGSKNISKDSGTASFLFHQLLFEKNRMDAYVYVTCKVLGTNYRNTLLEAVDPR